MREVFRQSCQQGGSEGVTVYRDAARVGRWSAEMWADVAIVRGTVVVEWLRCFDTRIHLLWYRATWILACGTVRQIARIAWLIGDSDVPRSAWMVRQRIDDPRWERENPGSIVPMGVGFEIPLLVPAVFELRVWIDNWTLCVFQIIEQLTAAVGPSMR